jgi:hypothetical protein
MKALDNFIRAMLGNLDATGRMWARIGVVVLIVAAAMSWGFGSEVSWKHASFLAALTFVAAFGPDAAHRAWHKGRPIVACSLMVGCAGLLWIEFYTHAGYTAGLRGYNIETASVQNVRYDQRQDDVREGKASLALWEKRLTDLETANAWSATVTAEALRAQLASANLAIEQEAAKGGCKARCLARTKERDDLAARIAIAEERATLTSQIEATKRLLAKARDTAAVTEHKSSAVVHQNQFLAKAITLVSTGSLEPTPYVQAAAEQSANLAMALAATGMPAFCLFIAGLYRRPDDENHEIGRAAEDKGRPHSLGQPQLAPAQPTKTTTQLVPVPETRVIKTTITDRAWAEAWESAMRQSRLAA